MELFFLVLLIFIMAAALGSGYPVAFALPGAAIITIGLAAGAGALFGGSTDAFFHSGGPSQWLSAGVTNLRGVYWEVERDTLIAIPLFIFMGIMLQRSKIAEDLLVAMAQLFGPVPGGLGISVVFVGALLAATTGIVGATVVAMGLISLPAMLRNNYSPSLATGTIAASGTLGQIIPPSIVLIILADQLASATDQASAARKALHKEATGELSMPSVFDVGSTSAGEMFLGAFVPGLLLVAIYMVYILIYAILNPKRAPAVPYEGARDNAFWRNIFLTLVPPLALIFLVLGSIIAGIATVNQAGAIGAAGAMVMAGYRLGEKRRDTYYPAFLAIAGIALIAFALNTFPMNLKAAHSNSDWVGIGIGVLGSVMVITAICWSGLRIYRFEQTLNNVMLETAKTTSLVFIILLGAAMLTAAFRAFGGEELVRDFLMGLPGGFWMQFIIVMLVIFILGFFLDFIEIAVVVVPIVAPILLADPGANITAVWLGVMIGLNIQTSFLTPPFGFALFYLRGVAPSSVKTLMMYKGVIPFIALQLLALAVTGLYPQLVNYLPNRVSYLSETAPPPRNPKLQYCVDSFVFEQLDNGVGDVPGKLATARSIDLSALPAGLQKDLSKSFDQAQIALDAVPSIHAAERAVEEAAVDYRPILRDVRAIQKQVNRLAKKADDLGREAGRLRATDDKTVEQRARMEARKAELEAEIAQLQSRIPADWDEVHKVFEKLTKAETNARNTHRRAADTAYDDAAEVLAVLNGTPALLALEGEITALRSAVESGDAVETAAKLDALADQVREIEGAGDVRKGLNNARRVLEKTPDDRAKALADFDSAVAELASQKTWRQAADSSVKPQLQAYVDGILPTLGARSLSQLSEDQALYIASCNAGHRDLSLNF